MSKQDYNHFCLQFLYGEDGLDIGRLPFYSEKQLPFVMVNTNDAMEKEMEQLKAAIGDAAAPTHEHKVKRIADKSVVD